MSASYKPTKDFYYRLAMEELKRGNIGNVRLIEDTIGKYPKYVRKIPKTPKTVNK